MNSLIDNLRYGSFRRSGLLLTVLAGVVGVGLFFIPELLSVQKSLSAKNKASSAESEGTVVDTVALEEPELSSEEAAPMERAALRLSREEAVENKPAPRARIKAAPEVRDSVVVEDEDDSEGSGSALGGFFRFFGGGDKKVVAPTRNRGKARPQAEEPEAVDTQAQVVSWREIQDDQSVRQIKTARERITDLAATFDARKYPATRYALLNFANALNLVVRPRTAQVMTPNEAVRYLLSHQRSVVESMQREAVDRSDIIKWSEISLGSALDQTRAGQSRVDIVPPFNPRLHLTELNVRHPPNKYGRFKEKNKVYVQFSGVVFGKDIDTIEFVRENGTVHRSLKVAKKVTNGYRSFESPQLDGRESWTVRVTDRFGESFEKRYAFYPRVQAFPWSSKARGYVLPFNQVEPDSNNFAPGLVDLRLDRFFSLGRPRRADGGEYTLTSGAQDFSVF